MRRKAVISVAERWHDFGYSQVEDEHYTFVVYRGSQQLRVTKRLLVVPPACSKYLTKRTGSLRRRNLLRCASSETHAPQRTSHSISSSTASIENGTSRPRSGRLHVDHEFEGGGLFDRKITGHCSIEYLIYECRGSSPRGGYIGSVIHRRRRRSRSTPESV